MKRRKLITIISFFMIICVGVVFIHYDGINYIKKLYEKTEVVEKENTYKMYIKSYENKITLKDMSFIDSDEITRGTEVIMYEKEIEQIIDEENTITYKHIKHNKNDYLILEENLTDKYDDVIAIEKQYVRTPTSLYENSTDVNILSLVTKGSELQVIGFDELDDEGYPNMYKVSTNEKEGYVYRKYLVNTKEEADKHYDSEGIYQIHSSLNNRFGGGDGASLDYYPVEKPKFENNIIPNEVRSLYLTVDALNRVDDYINLAKEANINAFVVDIKENSTIGYQSKVMEELSPTSYSKAYFSMDDYREKIKKLKDNGFYVIGRIVTFKDDLLVADHNDVAIRSNYTNRPYMHQGSYWPTAFNRFVWEYNVKIAIEAVTEMGFNEIQFDYVRFPDGTGYVESIGQINMQNEYNETKAQAIQRFLMYACDEIHKYNAYVSADVFGESAYNYITAYGQYWPAISNVVDVISAMPYPDHFNAYEFGLSEIVWTIPYSTLNAWGQYAANRQKEIPTPANVRTWIQAYDAIRSPYTIYDASKISDQIRGLYNNGLNGGYMTWNGSANIDKYRYIQSAFKGEY